jgi:ATP-dependent Lon protease
MTSGDEGSSFPEDFGGRVRLFPLPELVVFPHAMQPLHIFEPRYCDLLADAMASDHLIAMATVVGGLPAAANSQPQLHPTLCIGRIVSHVETEAGTHNILLIGAKRARIRQEIKTNRPFRMADIELAADVQPVSETESQRLKMEVLNAFSAVIPGNATVQQNLHELMASQMGLSAIADIIAYTLPLGTPAKLQLLDLNDVGERAKLLVELLKRLPKLGPAQSADSPLQAATTERPAGKSFPPPFSLN